MDRIEFQFLARRGFRRIALPIAIAIIVILLLVTVGSIMTYLAASKEAESYANNPYANSAISNSEYVVTYVDAMSCIGKDDKESLEACDHDSNQSSTMIELSGQVLNIDGKDYVAKDRDSLNQALLKSNLGKMDMGSLSLEKGSDDDGTTFVFHDSKDNTLTVTITRNKDENVAIKSMETKLHGQD